MGPDGRILLMGPALSFERAGVRRALAAAAAAVSTMLVLASPLKLCLVATVFHLPCPGCGLTRAAVAMLRGDFGQAFALHPLSLALVPLIVWMIAAHTVRYVRTGTPWKHDRLPRWSESVAAGLALLLVGVWLARFCGFCGGPVSV